MQKTWNRLEQWLLAHDPARLADLRPPARAGQLAGLEATLSLALPHELAESLRRHDGQARQAQALAADIAGSDRRWEAALAQQQAHSRAALGTLRLAVGVTAAALLGLLAWQLLG
ncbi:hypothetical protein [Stenotrophomonas maltophilia]|uniref:hypothetical protein n=1 Tax=Stenotrophomonas maltophilia TaxID=40324 RepID=UPI00387635B4